jgi:hypothetical protein
VESQDIDSLKRVLTMIQGSDFACDAQIGQNPKVVKLMRLIQTILDYMSQCQRSLQEEKAELEGRIQKLSNSLHHATQKQGQLTRAAQSRCNLERCPACGRNFATTKDLDIHMKKRHSHHFPAWQAIRRNEAIPMPAGSEKVERKVADLRKAVSDLTDAQVRFSRELEAGTRATRPFDARPSGAPPAASSEQPASEQSGRDHFVLRSDDEEPPTKPGITECELGEQPVRRRRRGIPEDLRERARDFCLRTAPLIPPGTIAKISNEISRNLYNQARAVGLRKPGQDMPTLRQEAREGLELFVPKTGPRTSARAEESAESDSDAAATKQQEQDQSEPADSSASLPD